MKTSFNLGGDTPETIEACKPPVVKAMGPPDPPGPVPPSPEFAQKSARIDAPDASSPVGTHASLALLAPASKYLGASGRLVLDQYGNAHAVLSGQGNPNLYRLGSAKANALIANGLRADGKPFTKKAVGEVTETLIAAAELLSDRVIVWNRVGKASDGTIVIALNDKANTQVWIGKDAVQIVTSGSEVLFATGRHSTALPLPASKGDWKLLKRYLNLDSFQFLIFVGYVTFVIAHAKINGAVFPILAVFGGQGSGKGVICKIALALIDPSTIGVRRMSANVADLSVMTAGQHVIVFDNQRHIPLNMSDALCMTSTGGAYTSRLLYTNDEQSVLWLHCAIILNGIHAFIQEPDLAQRCIVLQPKPIPEDKRQSESAMWAAFEADQPSILGGLYELIAQVLVHLPNVQVTHPQRMLDFVKWLAAMEMVHGAPVGAYQELYSDMVIAGQLDSVRDDLLGNAVLDFAHALDGEDWVGTPQELLNALTKCITTANNRIPRGWPETPISLSKRLASLQAALMTQGVQLQFTRGKTRQISIQFTGPKND